MVWYRRCWRRIERFFAARRVEEFSLDVAMAWVDGSCDFFAKERSGTLEANDVYLFRVAQMLGDYAVHGAALRRYSRSIDRLSRDDAGTVARFQGWLRGADRAVSTVRTYGTVAGEFVAFTGARGGLARCDAGTIDAFVATLAGYQPKTVEQKLCALRSFLVFASAEGLLDAAVADAVPAARSTKQARVPSVWEPGEVERVLDAIDRGNPSGKRDYAIVLLIARLGLRGVDVKALEFGDFDWPGNRLLLTQAKTAARVQLPLLKDVGWAVIDYIRAGLPACGCPQVFVRHTAPIGPFSDEDHLHQILVKHARVAHVPISEKRRHGMHSLRHTLATRLMENGTPLEQIADILGHESPAMTAVYARIHDETLRKAFDAYVATRVDVAGNRVRYEPDDDAADGEWMKERLSRARQTLSNGYCGRPLQHECPHLNACLSCPDFLTDLGFLDAHREQLDRTLTLVASAESNGQFRMVEINRTIVHNLERIVATLEDLEQGPSGAD